MVEDVGPMLDFEVGTGGPGVVCGSRTLGWQRLDQIKHQWAVFK